MPKSYKITLYDKFNVDSITDQPTTINSQLPLLPMPPDPQSIIYKSRDLITKDDYVKLMIEHEMEEYAIGRYNEEKFKKYIRKEYINAYHSEKHQLFILNGKKKFVLDFCKRTKEWDYIIIKTLHINMGRLLERLPHVKGVWFNFKNGLIRASALMGADIEGTNDFQKYNTEGEISTLSFLFDYNNMRHPIMLVNDGTIVLQGIYKEISLELDLIMEIKYQLLDGIYDVITINNKAVCNE